MTETKLLTFELTVNAETLDIYCDDEGLKDLIHRVNRLATRKDASLPDHDHWMAESIGGFDLTDQRQGKNGVLCVMVTAHYVPPVHDSIGAQTEDERSGAPSQMPEPALLAFEATPPTNTLSIFGNTAGLRSLAERLKSIATDSMPRSLGNPWTTTSLSDGLLTDEKLSDEATLIRQVVVHYRGSASAH
ncbi:MAG: hypothetical protein IT562_10940 [Alphaproteobacteria bacterium]|nr:hypothetical protein [Alphaproteobacteria bacterium]